MYRQKYEAEAVRCLHRLLADGRGEWVSGRTLKGAMNVGRRWWNRWDGLSFYRLMAELEDAGVVDVKDAERTVGGETWMMRCFRPSASARPTLVTHARVQADLKNALEG